MKNKLIEGEVRIRINNVCETTEDGTIKNLYKDKFNVVVEQVHGEYSQSLLHKFDVIKQVIKALDEYDKELNTKPAEEN